MNNGVAVFDAVVHAHDFRDQMLLNDEARFMRSETRNFLQLTQVKGPPAGFEALNGPPDHAWANRVLFEESATDFAMVQTVPLFGLFKDGMTPASCAYDLSQSNPRRLLFCGGVDPLHQGVSGALEEMERQVKEWGAVSIKFYQAQTPKSAWRADDEKIAYPLFEKASALGVKMVQFHKGLPLGRQRVEDLRPNDLQAAAYDFPNLNFGIHHLGDPYFDETINIASRFPNMYLILPIWFQRYFIQPMEMLHVLGKALLWVGENRLCYGTDAFLWPNLQTYIDLWAGLEMPELLQEQYGYPAISAETKRKVFGANFADGLGIEMDAEAGVLRRRETTQRLSRALAT